MPVSPGIEYLWESTAESNSTWYPTAPWGPYCFAVMDPYACIPTRCTLQVGHKGLHQSRTAMKVVMYEWQ